MCTAFIHRGRDVIYGFNMDINAEAFSWEVVAEKDAFYVAFTPINGDEYFTSACGIPEGYADYLGNKLRVQGVNSKGIFAVQLNNMGCKGAPFEVSEDAYPLYGIVDNLLSGRITIKEAEEIAMNKRLLNMPTGGIDIPDIAMHSLVADATGNMLLLEPGNGFARLCGRYSILSNFPILVHPKDLDDEHRGFYGLDRYEIANRILTEADDSFGVQDGLKLLNAVKQIGHWATHISFVWSKNENSVYYVLENDFEHVIRHVF